MGRRSFMSMAAVLGLCLAFQCADARETISGSAQMRKPTNSILVAQVRPMAMRGAGTAGAAQRKAGGEAVQGKFLHFKLGSVTLRPAVSGCTGAQVSIGF